MPVSVLIPPDNRLLGWSLSDLTLYGTQPAPDMTIGRAQDAGTAIAPSSFPAAVSPATDASAPSESDRAAGETFALLDHDEAQPPLTFAAPLAPAPNHVVPAAAEPQPSVPQPIGSGSFLQAPVVTPLEAATADPDTGGHGISAAPMAAAPIDGHGPIAGSVTAAVSDTLSHAADSLYAGRLTAHDPIEAVTNVADGAVPTLASVAADVAGLSHAADAAFAELDAGGTVDTLVADLGTAELVPPGADIAGLAAAATDPTPLSAFGGSDPAAGLQTLIGMVDSAEAFDIGHTTAAGVEATPNSILDALAADEAPSPLLGSDDDVDQHALDDHGIHLGI